MTADPGRFFDGDPEGRVIWQALERAFATLGGVGVQPSRSQLALRAHGRSFAFVWRPDRYLRSTVPAVLSIALPQRLDSPRFKEVLQVARHTWMHHLELTDPAEVDAEVRDWLSQAWVAARRRSVGRRDHGPPPVRPEATGARDDVRAPLTHERDLCPPDQARARLPRRR